MTTFFTLAASAVIKSNRISFPRLNLLLARRTDRDVETCKQNTQAIKVIGAEK